MAGGSFFRTLTNAARIQPLPGQLSLMTRCAMQLAADDLVSTEQFNIGGVSTVRGFPSAEHTGDRGYTSSVELYVPPYFLPKELEVPFSNTSFYDAL